MGVYSVPQAVHSFPEKLFTTVDGRSSIQRYRVPLSKELCSPLMLLLFVQSATAVSAAVR